MKTEKNPLTLVTPVLLQQKTAAPYFEKKRKKTKVDPNAAIPGPAMRTLTNSGNKTQVKQLDNTQRNLSTHAAPALTKTQIIIKDNIVNKWGYEKLLAVANDPKSPADVLDDLCYFVTSCRSTLPPGIATVIFQAIAKNPNCLPALRKKIVGGR